MSADSIIALINKIIEALTEQTKQLEEIKQSLYAHPSITSDSADKEWDTTLDDIKPKE